MSESRKQVEVEGLVRKGHQLTSTIEAQSNLVSDMERIQHKTRDKNSTATAGITSHYCDLIFSNHRNNLLFEDIRRKTINIEVSCSCA